MKRHILLGILLFAASMKAQITLDTTIAPLIGGGEDFYIAQISVDETKYVFLDTLNNTLNLYNLDFSPFITNINVPEPFGQGTTTFMQALYITRTLFDCDSTNIEYAYYSTRSSAKPFRIMRTDGTILLQVDSANGPYCIGSCLGLTDVFVPIRNTSEGAKLFLQTYKNGFREIQIYSLCGELPVDVFDFAQQQHQSVLLFPNPTSGLLTFQVNLLDNMQDYDLLILDENAKELNRVKVSASKTDYFFDINHFSSGTYYYSLCSKNKTLKSGKFVLSK